MNLLIFFSILISANAQIVFNFITNPFDVAVIFSEITFSFLIGTNFYKSSRQTVIIIHDCEGELADDSSSAIIEAYLLRGDHNVIFVDWGDFSDNLNYKTTAKKIDEAGLAIVDFLIRLQNVSFDISSLHLVGIGFGAHVAGSVGRNLFSSQNINLKRITGLDPVGPLFFQQRSFKFFGLQVIIKGLPEIRSGDAEFVDIIHTDAGLIGNANQTGDVDFWPNNGTRIQPGCLSSCLWNIFVNIDECIACSHFRAWRFYAESVRAASSNVFRSAWCPTRSSQLDECNEAVQASMGFYADQVQPENYGNYFLTTNRAEPFSQPLRL